MLIHNWRVEGTEFEFSNDSKELKDILIKAEETLSTCKDVWGEDSIQLILRDNVVFAMVINTDEDDYHELANYDNTYNCNNVMYMGTTGDWEEL